MKTGRLLALAVLFVVLPFVSPVAAQEAAPEPEITWKTVEVAPGIYAFEGVGGFAGGNVAVLTGEDGVVLIDDAFPPFSTSLLEAVAAVAGGPVDFVIDTHVHGDHTGGNAMMGEKGAVLVAHDNVRRRLAEEGIQGNPVPPEGLPVLTFADAVTFHLNGQEAYVFHVEHAHTDGDSVIYFRDADVIHAGDVLFHTVFPFIDLDSGGSVDGYIAAQERILEMAGPDTKILGGHGPAVATREDLKASIAMLKDAKARIQALMDAGSTLDQVVAARPLADYEEQSWSFITTERMIRQIYRGLGGEVEEE